jgi:hypothetical protein
MVMKSLRQKNKILGYTSQAVRSITLLSWLINHPHILGNNDPHQYYHIKLSYHPKKSSGQSSGIGNGVNVAKANAGKNDKTEISQFVVNQFWVGTRNPMEGFWSIEFDQYKGKQTDHDQQQIATKVS